MPKIMGFGATFGYLATYSAKSDVIFLLGILIYCKGDEILHLSRIVFEI